MPDTGIYRSNTPIQHSYDICGTVLSRWQREAQACWQITRSHTGSTVYIVQQAQNTLPAQNSQQSFAIAASAAPGPEQYAFGCFALFDQALLSGVSARAE